MNRARLQPNTELITCQKEKNIQNKRYKGKKKHIEEVMSLSPRVTQEAFLFREDCGARKS